MAPPSADAVAGGRRRDRRVYLVELSQHLHARPWRRRRGSSAEVEAHLHGRGRGRGRVARFGVADEVARALRRARAAWASAPRGAARVLGGVAVSGLVQGARAPHAAGAVADGQAPASLDALFRLATVCTRPRSASERRALLVRRAAVSLAACAALAATVVLLAVHAIRRADLVAGSPPSWQLALDRRRAVAAPRRSGAHSATVRLLSSGLPTTGRRRQTGHISLRDDRSYRIGQAISILAPRSHGLAQIDLARRAVELATALLRPAGDRVVRADDLAGTDTARRPRPRMRPRPPAAASPPRRPARRPRPGRPPPRSLRRGRA